jgi:hypothetical protein
MSSAAEILYREKQRLQDDDAVFAGMPAGGDGTTANRCTDGGTRTRTLSTTIGTKRQTAFYKASDRNH